MLTQMVQTYDKHNDHSSDDLKGLKSFTDNLIDTYEVLVVAVCKGSIVVILKCPTLKSLEQLWSDYLSGHLDKVAERYLVTDEIKKNLNLETTCLKTTIDEEHYLNCKEAFMELASTCLGEYKQNVWEVQLYQVVHEKESSLAFQFQECTICQWCMGRSAVVIIIIVIVISSTTLMMITLIAICTAPKSWRHYVKITKIQKYMHF